MLRRAASQATSKLIAYLRCLDDWGVPPSAEAAAAILEAMRSVVAAMVLAGGVEDRFEVELQPEVNRSPVNDPGQIC